MALQVCSGNNPFIRNANKRRLVLSAQNADVAQTSVGVTYSSIKLMKTRNVLYMLTTDTFARGQKASTFAFDCLVKAKRLL